MKKMTKLMVELGFDPDGSPTVKEAFLHHLIKARGVTQIHVPAEKILNKDDSPAIKVLPETSKPEQLSFSFINELVPKSSFSLKAPK